MKGVILAGGKGTRLWPLTEVTNKHLIPVGNIPMIEYPLHTLKQLNIDSISVVTGGEYFQNIAEYLGKLHPEINFSYHYQKEAGGISQALYLTKKFVGDEKLAVILGDNIFEDNFHKAAKKFKESNFGTMLFLKKVANPERFSVAEIKNNKIISMKEKPKNPKSNLIVTGLYFYDSTVFEKIEKLKPSNRGELEVTDLNNLYLSENRIDFHILENYWSDAGTIESRESCEKIIKKNNLERKIFNSLKK